MARMTRSEPKPSLLFHHPRCMHCFVLLYRSSALQQASQCLAHVMHWARLRQYRWDQLRLSARMNISVLKVILKMSQAGQNAMACQIPKVEIDMQRMMRFVLRTRPHIYRPGIRGWGRKSFKEVRLQERSSGFLYGHKKPRDDVTCYGEQALVRVLSEAERLLTMNALL